MNKPSTKEVKMENNADTAFKAFAEEMYKAWQKGDKKFSEWLNAGSKAPVDFKKKFSLDHLPEPYYYFKNCKNPLYVLNNNPGQGMNIQKRTKIKGSCYEDISKKIANDNYKNSNKIGKSAVRRIKNSEKCAEAFGCDGVVFVETFFLHSPDFKKNYFLKYYQNNEIVKTYFKLLGNFLKDKKVLCITATSSRGSLQGTKWLNEWAGYQAKLIGLNLAKAKSIAITKKGKKVTSCLIHNNGKFLLGTMGSNNIPKNLEEKLRKYFNK